MLESDQPQLPCDGKLRFNSAKEANATATVAEHQHGTKLKAYVCKHCGLWHLASR